MEKDKLIDMLNFIKFFQNKDYIERQAQINSFYNFDNYIDYYISEKLSPIKYLKIKAKTKLSKNKDYIKQTQNLLKQINTSDYVCVISPYYKDKKLDGYYKRIEQIDKEVLSNFKTIYLDYTQLGNRQFSINCDDKDHIVINFNSFDDNHIECIKEILNSIKRIYIHSIHVLMPDTFNYQLFDYIFDNNNKTILDLHGAVTEELKQFDTKQRAKLAETIEELALTCANKIVCMSEAMVEYYISKYDIDSNKFVSVSIIPFDYVNKLNKTHNNTPVVVYAGGIQKWQNIDLIKKAVETNKDKYFFKIFTHNCESLKQDWKDIKTDNLIIDSKSNQEIYDEYKNCDFGFILRDDTIVNNVACPTKLMEYLSFGIIPILKSDKIGSFKKYGLKYISLTNFNNGIIPNTLEKEEMINNNYQVLLKIINQSNEGTKAIIDFLKN